MINYNYTVVNTCIRLACTLVASHIWTIAVVSQDVGTVVKVEIKSTCTNYICTQCIKQNAITILDLIIINHYETNCIRFGLHTDHMCTLFGRLPYITFNFTTTVLIRRHNYLLGLFHLKGKHTRCLAYISTTVVKRFCIYCNVCLTDCDFNSTTIFFWHFRAVTYYTNIYKGRVRGSKFKSL